MVQQIVSNLKNLRDNDPRRSYNSAKKNGFLGSKDWLRSVFKHKKVHLKSAPQEHQVENFKPKMKLSEIAKSLIFNGL